MSGVDSLAFEECQNVLTCSLRNVRAKCFWGMSERQMRGMSGMSERRAKHVQAFEECEIPTVLRSELLAVPMPPCFVPKYPVLQPSVSSLVLPCLAVSWQGQGSGLQPNAQFCSILGSAGLPSTCFAAFWGVQSSSSFVLPCLVVFWGGPGSSLQPNAQFCSVLGSSGLPSNLFCKVPYANALFVRALE
eukprot:2453069-Amphidinium_carterae.1